MRNDSVTLSGTSLARGRNGEFIPTEANLIVLDPAEAHGNAQTVIFGVRSRRAGQKIDPVALLLTAPDARRIRDLWQTVNGGMSTRRYAIEQAISLIKDWRRGKARARDAGFVLVQVDSILRDAQ